MSQLIKTTNQANLTAAWRTGALKKTGTINEIYYEFHGVGIYIEIDSAGVEIDFLPDNQAGGFDSWRIWQFVKDKSHLYPSLASQDEVEIQLATLESMSKVKKVLFTNLYTTTDLFYLNRQA